MYRNRLHLDVVNKKFSFISPSFPFVCQKIPSVKPFVPYFLPFVSFHKKRQGFTLIELIVTISIIGILIAISYPYLGNFISSTRLTTQANELLTDLNTARSEAIKRGVYVGVCASTGGSSCTSGASFQNGWVVFVDADNSGTWSTGDSVLRTHAALEGSTLGASDTASAIFDISGLLQNSTSTITYTFCDSRLQQSRLVSVTATGRVSVDTGTC